MRMSWIAVSVLWLATGGHASTDAAFTFPRSTPEAQGVSSAALLRFVDEAEQNVDALHSVMVVRHGQVVAEGWWKPYAADEPHMLFSLSKSFTSTAVGLAIADGKLKLDDPILRFFPDDAPADPSRVAEGDARSRSVDDVDWPSRRGHPRLPVLLERQPGEEFPEPAGVAQAGNVLRLQHAGELHAVGNRAESDRPDCSRLPATDDCSSRSGIGNPTWEASKQGVSMGGFGLSVRTEDIARFGQLYLQKGQWQGKQLVPAAWVEAATSRQMSNGSSPTSDWEQGYGYQFWRCRHGFYRGDGAHGQFCIVMPQYDTVVAITSGTRDMASVMNVVWDRLVPALEADRLPDDTASSDKLKARLAGLTLRPETTTASSSIAKSIAGRRYTFATNRRSIEAVAFESMDASGAASLTLRMNGQDQHLKAKPNGWQTGTLESKDASEPVAVSGGVDGGRHVYA